MTRLFQRAAAAGPTALVLLVAAGTLAACNRAVPVATPSTEAAPVRVEEVHKASLAGSLRAVGLLRPATELRLAFKTGGAIGTVSVEQGQAVHAGQELARLQQDEVAAATAQARAVADKAQRDLERGRALFADEVATREQLEDLTTARDVARARLRATEFNARLSTIVAPASGIVLRRLAEPGELVAAGQPVLVLGDTSGGWIVSAALSDRDVVRVRPGDRAQVTFDAFAGRVFDATVTELSPAADPVTGTYEMKLAVSPGGLRFVQGLVAKVEMTGNRGASVPVVPVQALLEANGSSAVVYVVAARPEQTVARRVPVRIGRLVGERVEVLGGLTGGERVVVDGASYLRDGEAVRVLGAG